MRISLGLSLVFIGFTHYSSSDFVMQAGSGLGALEPIGIAWGYILPGLMILGGALLTFQIFPMVAAYASGIALASIPAGLLLKSAMGTLPLESAMPAALNALIWFIVLFLSMQRCCCARPVMSAPSIVPPKPRPTPPAPSVPSSPMLVATKSAAPAPVVTKSVLKKAPVKKVAPKKEVLPPAPKGGLDV